MNDITVKRYPSPTETGWAGYIEPKDKTWILFGALDGSCMLFPDRDPMTGAVYSAQHDQIVGTTMPSSLLAHPPINQARHAGLAPGAVRGVHVRRFAPSCAPAAILAQVSLPDGAIVVVDAQNRSTFWRPAEPVDLDTKGAEILIDAELPSRALTADFAPIPSPGEVPRDPASYPSPPSGKDPNPFGYRVERTEGDEHHRPGFFAVLEVWGSGRMIEWGATEYEAVRNLIHFVVRSTAAGSIDPEGKPVLARNAYRYKMVWDNAVFADKGVPADETIPSPAALAL